MELMRSKQRVADHGEVFTPPAMVDAMVGLVASEAERIDARFLEPACGSGNFLMAVLLRKLRSVDTRYRRSEFERRHAALLSLMSLYGVELLPDNVEECRSNLVSLFMTHINLDTGGDWHDAARAVVQVNIVHGDALSMTTQTKPARPITFSEWAYLGKGRYHRRDFRLDTLTQMATFGEGETLFADVGKHDIFLPVQDHGLVSLEQIAESWEADR